MTEPTTVGVRDPAVAERLARRYPPPRVRRRTKVAITAAATLVALGWLIWTALLHADPPVSGQVASYEVLSDTSMKVTVTVERRDPSRAATCRVQAQATDFQPVAESPVAFEPSSYAVANKSFVLTTLRRATSVTVKSCTSS